MAGVPVVDVFAGPGGLNEGFSSFGDGQAFETAVSVEMDPIACQTLRLRAAVRSSRRTDGAIPRAYFDFMARRLSLGALVEHPDFARHWKQAGAEVVQHELAEKTRTESNAVIRTALGDAVAKDNPWVLIGGPPCQAYSMVGRSRRKHDTTFADDSKHTLYREYLNIISEFKPHVFVMENVKGMLSSKHDGGGIFRRILDDLRAPADGLRYELRSFVFERDPDSLDPPDYVIRAEQYGVPQTRHRVIILGVRSDVDDRSKTRALIPNPAVSVGEAIGDLPRIRSGLSPRHADSWEAWLQELQRGWRSAVRTGVQQQLAVEQIQTMNPSHLDLGAPVMDYSPNVGGELGSWLTEDAGDVVTHHTSRNHMSSDLARYAYMAHMGVLGQRPRVTELPDDLLPNHANVRRPDGTAAPFMDRFRVQLEGLPSSTVTSHIAKDGHYYIHYDPLQMRSLSVREAARLQTFPDNYFFTGNRTQQYHQVGNAVPPYLAKQLASVVAGILGTE